MALTTRQYLKTLAKSGELDTLRKLFKLSNLSEMEYWLLYYAYVDNNGKGRLRENTCMKLNIRTTKYATLLNEALIKVDYTINSLDKIRTL
jgi:hypothetical protein